jgi:hypothetical protein
MTNRERMYSRLLMVYPRWYRERRGEEINSTLLEVAAAGGRISWLEAATIAVHGLRVRLSIDDGRFAGDVLALAALPGLMMGAGLALTLGIFGDWLPHTTILAPHPAPIALQFGQFWTMGPALYAVWVAGATWAAVTPRYEQAVAWVCLAATVATRLFGGLARPPAAPLLLLGLLGVPAALAPRAPRSRRQLAIAVLSGVTVAAFITVCVAYVSFAGGYWFQPLYWNWGGVVVREFPYMTGVALLLAVGMLFLGYRRGAAALTLSMSPWLLESSLGLRPAAIHWYGPSALSMVSAAVGSAVAVLLVTCWVVDVRKSRNPVTEPT